MGDHDSTGAAVLARPRRRRRWLRVFLALLVAVLALGLFAPQIAAATFLRGAIERALADAAGRPAAVGKVSASWWGGIRASDIRVEPEEGFSPEPALEAPELHASIEPGSLLRGSVRGAVRIDRPVVRIESRADPAPDAARKRRTSIDGWLRARGEKPSEPIGRHDVRVEVALSHGRVVYRDLDRGANGTLEITDIEVGGSLRLDGPSDGRVEFVLVGPSGRTEVRVSGKADMTGGAGDGSLDASIGQIDLRDLEPLLRDLGGPERLRGRVAGDIAVAVRGGGLVSARAAMRADGVEVAGGPLGPDAVAAFDAGRLDARAEADPSGPRAVRIDLDLSATALELTGLAALDKGVHGGAVTLAADALLDPDKGLLRLEPKDGRPGVTIRGPGISLSADGEILGLLAGEEVKGEVRAMFSADLTPTVGRALGLLDSPDQALAGALRGEIVLSGAGSSARLRASVAAEGLAVGAGALGDEEWREDRLSLETEGTFAGSTRSFQAEIETLSIASSLARASLAEPARIDGGSGALRGRVKIAAQGDAGRAAAVFGRVISLDALRPYAPAGAFDIDATFDLPEGREAARIEAAVALRDGALTIPAEQSGTGRPERAVPVTARASVAAANTPAGWEVDTHLAALEAPGLALATGDTPLHVRIVPGADPTADGAFTVRADLARLAHLAGGALGLEPGARVEGTVVSSATIRSPGAGAMAGEIDLRAEGLKAAAGVFGAAAIDEPSASLKAGFELRPESGGRRVLAVVREASAAGVDLAPGEPPLSVEVAPGGDVAARGAVKARIDLARLSAAAGRLLPLEPGERLAGIVSIDGRGAWAAGAGEAEVRVEGKDVLLPPSLAKGRAIEEPSLLADLKASFAPGDITVEVREARGAGIHLARGDAPLVVRVLGDAPPEVLGRIDLRADLARLTGTTGGWIGLGPRERVEGAVVAKGEVAMRGAKVSFAGDASVTGLSAAAGVLGPDALRDENVSLKGRFEYDGDAGRLDAKEAKVVAPGLSMSLDAAAKGLAGGRALSISGRIEGTADLARLAALGGRAAGLPTGSAVAGTAQFRADAAEGAGGRLRGTVRATVKDLAWRGGPREPVLREPSLSLDIAASSDRDLADIEIATLDARGSAFTVTGGGRIADLRGTPRIDLRLESTQDLAALPVQLRAFLPEKARDASGSGEGEMRITARGPVARGAPLRNLAIDGAMHLDSLVVGDLRLEGLSAAIAGADGRTELRDLKATVNGGPTSGDAWIDWRQDPPRWECRLKGDGIRASEFAPSGVGGRLLKYGVPLFASAARGGTAYSGTISLDTTMRGTGLSGDALLSGLSGSGRFGIAEGAVERPSILGALGVPDDRGLRMLLSQALPDAGDALRAASQRLAFKDLTATFDVGSRRVTLKALEIDGQEIQMSISGHVGFDGDFRLRTAVQIPGAAGKRLAQYLPEGLPLGLSGTFGAKTSVKPEIDVLALSLRILAGGLRKQ